VDCVLLYHAVLCKFCRYLFCREAFLCASKPLFQSNFDKFLGWQASRVKFKTQNKAGSFFTRVLYKNRTFQSMEKSKETNSPVQFSFSGNWELPFAIAIPCLLTIEYVFPVMKWSADQKASGRGWPPKNALNRTSDLSGCENGASWDAPLMVAKDRILP